MKPETQESRNQPGACRRQAAAPMLIPQRAGDPPDVDLKALLASAPLDGIDLDRASDFGRDIDL
jgi:hypothetical protein